jgi:hypothetical protein
MRACKLKLKALENHRAALRKIQDDMVLHVSRMQDGSVHQQGEAPFCTDEMSENSVFLAGILDIRQHLDMIQCLLSGPFSRG